MDSSRRKTWGLFPPLTKQVGCRAQPAPPSLPSRPSPCHLFQVMFEDRKHPPRCLQGPSVSPSPNCNNIHHDNSVCRVFTSLQTLHSLHAEFLQSSHNPQVVTVVVTVIIPRFIAVEIEAPKGYVTHPRSYRQEWVDPVTSASVE